MANTDWENGSFQPPTSESSVDWDKGTFSAPPKRSIGAALNDTVIEIANAAAGGVSSAANFVKPGNAASKWIDENIVKAGEEKQSDVVKAEKQRLSTDLAAAEGVGDEVAAVGRYIANNPVLSAAQAAGSFAGPGLAVKGATTGARVAGAGAKAMERAGRAGGVAAGAAMAGGDAAGTAYELASKAGATEDQAVAAGRQASVLPAIVGGAGGAFGAEKLLAGAKGFTGGTIARALKTGASEALQEGVEEGVTQYEGQRAAVPYDPNIDPSKGVAGAAAMGAALGGITGAGMGALDGIRHGGQQGADPLSQAVSGQQAAEAAAADAQAKAEAATPSWTTAPGVADPNAPMETAPAVDANAPRIAEADFETQPGAAPIRENTVDFTREFDTGGLALDDGKAPGLGYNPLAGTPTVFPDGSVALNGEQEFQHRTGVDPARAQIAQAASAGGALSSAALAALDTGASGALQQQAASTQAQQAQAQQLASAEKASAAQAKVDEKAARAGQSRIDMKTGDLLEPASVSNLTGQQLTETYRAARKPETRRILEQEMSRRDQQALQAELDAEQAGTVSGAERADAAFASVTEDAQADAPASAPQLSAREQAGLASSLAGHELAAQPLSSEMAGLQAQLAQVQQRAADNGSWNVPLMGQRRRIEAAIAQLQAAEKQTTQGVPDAPQAAQAQQGRAQPPQGGAAPAVPSTDANAQGRPGADGAQQTAAAGLTDGTPTANPGAQAAPAAGPQAQAPSSEVEALRQQLRDVEAKILLAAPSVIGQGGGDIEAAMRSRKVPVTLKAQRKKLVEKVRSAREAEVRVLAQESGASRVPLDKAASGQDKEANQVAVNVNKALAAIKNVAKSKSDAPPTAAPPAPKKSVPRGVLAKKAANEEAARADFFAPGNIVKSYDGHDRVVAYTPPDSDGRWSVTVRAVEKQGDAWVDKAGAPERVHGTQPDARELKAGPVARATQEVAPVPSPVETSAPTDRITDFGEKIGGARKDQAGTKGAKVARPRSTDERPAWARRYEVSQIAKSSRVGEEGRWVVRDSRRLDAFKQPRQMGRETYATKEEAEQAVPLLAVSQKHRVVPVRGEGAGYEIWRDISDRKRVKVVDQVFPTREAALEHMVANAQAIIETNTTFGEADLPRPPSDQRIGVERRTGDARDSDFMEVFGFRGVEFGNWNNQQERQELLNDAYDGLLDLAEVMDVPPRAISLNGELALAFGARGHGLSGARAHYELDKVVINLTKMNGAGSLAHEWFHALDHYFGRQDGKAPAEWVVAKDGTRSLQVHDAPEDDMASGGTRGERSGMRPELREAFADVMRTIARKAEAYVEDTARADRFVAAAREEVKRRLDGIRADLARDLDTRYYKRHNKAATAEQLAEFDSVAEKIVAGELLELRVESKGSGRSVTSGVRWTNDALNRLSTVMKAVRGRQGFTADQDGPLDRLRGLMQNYSARLKMLADAQDSTEKSRAVPTEFVMNAKELDQGRGQDYWTRPHELAARAFQGYVEDKIAERGGRSPFLNYGPENAAIATPWGFKRPFPAGTERLAINKSLDKLVDVIQTREGENGDVALFRREGSETSERATEFDVDSFLKAMGRPSAYSEAARRQAIDSVSATVDAIRTAWGPNAPEVVVAFDMQDERIPEAARKADLRQRSGGARGAPEGFYYRGKAYLMASRLNTPNDAARVLYHEVLGHHGLRGKFGRDLDQVLNQIATMRKAEVSAKMQEYGLRGVNNLSVREAAEEVLAEMAEKNPQLPFVQRAISAIRNFLRTHVLGFQSLRLTDSDIIQAYILPARGWVERGGPGGPGGGVSFSRDAGQMEADALRLLAAAARSSGNENTTLVLGPVTDDALAMLQREGVPVEVGYRHTADMYAVRHALSRHGDAQVEAKQGQLPLSDADIVAIPEAIAAPDAWILGAKTPRGQDIVGNLKRLPDGTVLYLEEVRSGRKALAMTSMRKYPGTTDFETIRSRIVPSYAQSDTGDVRIVYPAGAAGQGEVLFSRSKPQDGEVSALDRVGDAIKSVTVQSIKDVASYKKADWLGLGLQALGRRQIVEIYGKDLPGLQSYSNMSAQMEADKNEVGAEADALATRWGKLNDERQLAELMHDATLAQIDPEKAHAPGDDQMQYRMLQGRFNALSNDAKAVYRDARAAYQDHHAKVRTAIRERIERSELKGERKAALLKSMDDEFFKAIRGVYFPLARFGQYVVAVKGPDGKIASVNRAETMGEAQVLRQSLLKAFPPSSGHTVVRPTLSKEFIASRDAVGRGFMTELYQALDKQDMDAAARAELEDTLGQLYLSSLPDLSWAKHGIHRKGTPGFSQDARRAFAQNMFHGGRYLAKLRYSDLMQDELNAMQEHVDTWKEVDAVDQPTLQRVVDEMNKRHESFMNPKSNPISTALTSFGFIFHLGLSPASALVNLTQTALVAYPVMGAKWGYDQAAVALLKASQQAAKGKNDITGALSADERAAYDEAVRAGTIDVTMAHDLAGIAQGEDAGVMWKLRPVMKWASFMFHHAERFNRQVTFIAAYRLAREAGAGHQAAFEQATDATYKGHFDYSAGNRPRIMQGNVAKVLLLFKQYGQNMVYTLGRSAQQAISGETPEVRREARRTLGGLLVMHGMAAGALGLPMVTTLLAAASMLGGDGDEPWDAKVALQNLLADAFGQKAAEVLAHGLSRLTPWDISGRVGLDKLIFPDVQEGLEGQRLAESAMTAALGPVAGIGVNLLKGVQMMGEGRYAMGLEAIMPAALRGPVKAIRYANEGVQDKSGVSILDEVSPSAVAGQALGFSPSEARNAQEGKSAVLAQDRALSERRQELLTKIAKATMAKDDEAKTEVREEIKRFNEKNPGRRINPNHIMASVRNRQKRIDQAQDGVYLPRNRRDAMEVGRFAQGPA